MASNTSGPAGVESGPNPLVLLAEDDVNMRYVLQYLLAREGYQVEPHADGEQIITRVSTGPPPALVVVDVMMPFVGGIEAVKSIRATRGWESVPVIVLSGKSSEEDMVAAFRAGANDYVTKPFRPRELIARVGALIASSASSAVSPDASTRVA